MKPRVLVVGDVMLDRYWFGEVSRISPEAPVPVVVVQPDRTEDRLGGAANVARNCAALGARTHLLSVVGADGAGRKLAQLARKAGIRASLHSDPATPTTVKLRIMGRRQQLLRIDLETPPSKEVLASKLAGFGAALRQCDVLVLSDYGKGGLAHIAKMIGEARRAGKPVLVDPKGDDYSRYRGATMITPNTAELRQVVGEWRDERDLARRVQRLRKRLQLQAVLLTRSEQGMSLYTGAGAMHVPAQAREVYDVSGAGDTVIGALAVMLAARAELQEAVHVANRAAGIVVGKLGTAVATREELFGK
ncbi:MAG: D-glycero-beta-D-manno-heptose-7-phosphate kinase [Burkholderiales bacterium]